MRRIDYLPIEHIFNLLSVYRRIFRKGEGGDIQTLRAVLKRRGLRSWAEAHSHAEEQTEVTGSNPEFRSTAPPRPAAQLRPIPRISFWLRLCQSASLLDEDEAPYPTLLVQEWLSWPFLRQISHLLEAWLQAPNGEKYRNVRKELLRRLVDKMDSTHASVSTPPIGRAPLGAANRQELVGLQALGICEGEQLTQLGVALLAGPGAEQFVDLPPERWSLENDQLLKIPFPPAWDLVWELERYIDPAEPGVYVLESPALRLAAQRDVTEQHAPNRRTSSPHGPSLLEILERGLGEKPPAALIQRLANEPTVRVIPGPVLEFTAPEELKTLRKSPGLRRDLEHLLSPRHVALDPWRAQRIVGQLERRGLISETDLSNITPYHGALAYPQNNPEVLGPEAKSKSAPKALNKSDHTYLLSLMLLAESLQNAAIAPPGLLSKLTGNLDYSLRAAAARKATAMLEQIKPQPEWIPEIEPPEPPSEEMVMAIQGAIDREESIDVVYKASGRHSAEYRHLTPLMVEPRGERLYLIAYCHTRRANRTFRLDRLKLCLYSDCSGQLDP